MKRSITILSAIIFSGAMSSIAMAQTPGEMANFNHFLDNHPELAQRLAADPRLADNPQFLANHPGLQNFLAQHPGVSAQLDAEPGHFINREGHYEWAHSGGPITAGPGIYSGPVARFDNGYLDEHPEVAQQLGHEPRLADNPQFLATHPGLDSYLAAHPGVRTELQAHPDRFMTDEWRHERFDDGHGHPIANTDHYLDQHPEVSQQLSANPRLVDNRQYVDSHPGLHEFLATHRTARAEWKSHPKAFMNREEHYDKKH